MSKKPKSQEGNKSFVPEQRKSSVFHVFRDSYAYVYERFTHPYIMYILGIQILLYYSVSATATLH